MCQEFFVSFGFFETQPAYKHTTTLRHITDCYPLSTQQHTQVGGQPKVPVGVNVHNTVDYQLYEEYCPVLGVCWVVLNRVKHAANLYGEGGRKKFTRGFTRHSALPVSF